MRTFFSIIILLSSTCITLGLAGFACPVNNVNFNLNDLDHPIFNVKSWQDCGKASGFPFNLHRDPRMACSTFEKRRLYSLIVPMHVGHPDSQAYKPV